MCSGPNRNPSAPRSQPSTAPARRLSSCARGRAGASDGRQDFARQPRAVASRRSRTRRGGADRRAHRRRLPRPRRRAVGSRASTAARRPAARVATDYIARAHGGPRLVPTKNVQPRQREDAAGSRRHRSRPPATKCLGISGPRPLRSGLGCCHRDVPMLGRVSGVGPVTVLMLLGVALGARDAAAANASWAVQAPAQSAVSIGDSIEIGLPRSDRHPARQPRRRARSDRRYRHRAHRRRQIVYASPQPLEAGAHELRVVEYGPGGQLIRAASGASPRARRASPRPPRAAGR